MDITSKIESILFVSIRPLSLKNIATLVGDVKPADIEKGIIELEARYNRGGSGVRLQKIDDKVQMVTAPENAAMVAEFIKDETTGELTPASMETLTVIAYRGPISKVDLEMIRGVNCSLIIRNLLIRGLIEERRDEKSIVPVYQITFDFLKYLGLNGAKDLPDYEVLNKNENLEKMLNPEAAVEATSQTIADTGSI